MPRDAEIVSPRAGLVRAALGAWAVLVLVVMAVFFARELKIADPVLQIRLFRIPAFAAGNTAIALSNLAMYTTLLAVPLLVALMVTLGHAFGEKKPDLPN